MPTVGRKGVAMLDAESAKKRANSIPYQPHSITRALLAVQAETLEECERHFSLHAGALYQSWLVTTRAELKKLAGEHA
jgi:hypothetical protein